MFQSNIILPGCQIWIPNSVAASSFYFAYSSTHVVYIFKHTPRIQLFRIISDFTSHIRSISFNPFDPNCLLVLTANNTFSLININGSSRFLKGDAQSSKHTTISAVPGLANYFTLIPDKHITSTWAPDGRHVYIGTEQGDVYLGFPGKPFRHLFNGGTVVTELDACTFEDGSTVLTAGFLDGSVIVFFEASQNKEILESNKVSLRYSLPKACKTSMSKVPAAGVSALSITKHDPVCVLTVLNGQHILAGTRSGVVCILEITRFGKLNMRADYARVPGGLSYGAWFPWTPGTFVVAEKDSGILRLWNVARSEWSRAWKVLDVGIRNVNAIPIAGKQWMAFGGQDGSVSVRHYGTWRVLYETGSNHTETIFALSLSRSAEPVVASASYDGTVYVRDLASKRVITSWFAAELGRRGADLYIPQRPEVNYALQLSPDDRYVAVSSSLGRCRVYTIGGEEVALLEHPRITGSIYSIAWSQCGRLLLVTAVNGIFIWAAVRSEDGGIIDFNPFGSFSTRPENRPISAVFLYPAGKHAADTVLIVFGTMKGDVSVMSLAAPALWDERKFASSERFAKHPESKLAVNPISEGGMGLHADLAWPELRKPLFSKRFHTSDVFSIAASPLVSNVFASASSDRTVKAFEISLAIREHGGLAVSVSQLRTFEGHKNRVRPLCWHPVIPSLLYSGSWDSLIKMWSVASGREKWNGSGHLCDVYALQFVPSSPMTLVSSSRDMSVRIWSGAKMPLSQKIMGACLHAFIEARSEASDEQAPLANLKRTLHGLKETRSPPPIDSEKPCGRFFDLFLANIDAANTLFDVILVAFRFVSPPTEGHDRFLQVAVGRAVRMCPAPLELQARTLEEAFQAAPELRFFGMFCAVVTFMKDHPFGENYALPPPLPVRHELDRRRFMKAAECYLSAGLLRPYLILACSLGGDVAQNSLVVAATRHSRERSRVSHSDLLTIAALLIAQNKGAGSIGRILAPCVVSLDLRSLISEMSKIGAEHEAVSVMAAATQGVFTAGREEWEPLRPFPAEYEETSTEYEKFLLAPGEAVFGRHTISVVRDIANQLLCNANSLQAATLLYRFGQTRAALLCLVAHGFPFLGALAASFGAPGADAEPLANLCAVLTGIAYRNTHAFSLAPDPAAKLFLPLPFDLDAYREFLAQHPVAPENPGPFGKLTTAIVTRNTRVALAEFKRLFKRIFETPDTPQPQPDAEAAEAAEAAEVAAAAHIPQIEELLEIFAPMNLLRFLPEPRTRRAAAPVFAFAGLLAIHFGAFAAAAEMFRFTRNLVSSPPEALVTFHRYANFLGGSPEERVYLEKTPMGARLLAGEFPLDPDSFVISSSIAINASFTTSLRAKNFRSHVWRLLCPYVLTTEGVACVHYSI
eukprot:gnl/Chilomastix_cuspidata/2119.p1 GENE.gnl/Chilomastix_cuspidata/2119~~gnl/Chilomastix_cuspidata/2119.p1  ORF type:complete len:1377 (-),score=416.23 gnl/Chilomastix_cuspidata/2119:1081-5211(-)